MRAGDDDGLNHRERPFSIVQPRVIAPTDHVHRMASLTRSADPSPRPRDDDNREMRILVADDESGVTSALRRGLHADGFAVDVADNGEDALWLAENNPYVAIVLDIMMPKINGYQVCARLRAGGNWTPVLMLTAKDGEYDEAEGLDTGADAYMTKPFSYVVLLANLRALIRRAGREPQADVLEAGDVRFDTRERRCWRGDTEVRLSAKAGAVLEFLMRRPGAVVTRDEILAGVWDHAFDGSSNIVEVYVARLRAALDTQFDRRLIETVRGIGYRLDPRGG
jgi:two-component system, OmpR family, response regulator